MKKFYLSYNPFLKELSCELEGEQVDLSSIWGNDKKPNSHIILPNKELAEWSDDFLKSICDLAAGDDIELDFNGIMRDYEFLEDSIENLNLSKKIKLIGKENCVYTKDQLEKLKKIFEAIQRGDESLGLEKSPFNELTTEELKDIFEKITSNDFEIAVVATMSSGKSTLINSMLGKELLPARNEATTATIARIYDENEKQNFDAIVKNAEGEVIGTYINVGLKDIDEINTKGNRGDDDSSERIKETPSTIEIHGDITGIVSNSLRLVLSDTPGPNNSQSQEHRMHIESLLKNPYKPMILYVLNATQLKTDDDENLLRSVAKAMNDEKAGRQAQDRFLFVLNKADAFDPAKGDSEKIENVIAKVKEYLENHDIKDPKIFPASALMAKVIRQHLGGEPLTETEEDEILPKHQTFIKREYKHFNDYATLSEYAKHEQSRLLSKYQEEGDSYKQALVYTGIPAIEIAISEYLAKYALPAKVIEGVASFKDKLNILGVEAREKEKLKGNQGEIDKCIKRIDEIKDMLENGEKGKELRNKIQKQTFVDKFQELLKEKAKEFFKEVKDELASVGEEKLIMHEAEKVLKKLQISLSNKANGFAMDITNMLNETIVDQAKESIEEYRKYVASMVHVDDIDISPASLLGNLSDINLGEVIRSYTEEKKIATDSYKESDATWYKPWTWLKETTVYEYEKEEYVDVMTIVATKIRPSILKFNEELNQMAMEEAQKQENRFKSFFAKQVENLDSAIASKLEEEKLVLSDKDKLEVMLAENEKKLQWHKKLVDSLESVLKM